MLTSSCLSLCAECSGTELTHDQTGGTIAECIHCGKNFLLPLTVSVQGSIPPEPVDTLHVADQCGESSPRIGERWRFVLSVLGSVLLNAASLYVAALFYFELTTDNEVGLQVEFTAGDSHELTFLADFDSGGSEPVDVLLDTAMMAAEISVTDLGEVALRDGALPDGIGMPEGSGAGGTGKGPGGSGMGIFRGADSSDSFAYVVDASGSMDGSRMTVVLNQLKHSIDSLADDQEFFVVFFNKQTFPMMWPQIEKRLVRATARNRERILKWAFAVVPQGTTMPEQSLQLALKLEPDVVFFLTDGDISAGALRIVKKFRRNPTIVNTICVGGDADLDVMQKIATAGNGTFLHVPESTSVAKSQ